MFFEHVDVLARNAAVPDEVGRAGERRDAAPDEIGLGAVTVSRLRGVCQWILLMDRLAGFMSVARLRDIA